MQAHMSGVPLDPMERELAVHSPAWEPPNTHKHANQSRPRSGPGGGSAFRFEGPSYGSEGPSYGSWSIRHACAPPTPLHGSSWRKPPAPAPRLAVRLLDSAVLMIAATFASQDDQYQVSPGPSTRLTA